jgi:hypothetical protein
MDRRRIIELRLIPDTQRFCPHCLHHDSLPRSAVRYPDREAPRAFLTVYARRRTLRICRQGQLVMSNSAMRRLSPRTRYLWVTLAIAVVCCAALYLLLQRPDTLGFSSYGYAEYLWLPITVVFMPVEGAVRWLSQSTGLTFSEHQLLWNRIAFTLEVIDLWGIILACGFLLALIRRERTAPREK